MNYPIQIGGETPAYLCEWNGGETIEIHTRQTLTDTYEFDPTDDSWAWEIQETLTLRELLDHLEREPIDKGRTFHNDNMKITRIR